MEEPTAIDMALEAVALRSNAMQRRKGQLIALSGGCSLLRCIRFSLEIGDDINQLCHGIQTNNQNDVDWALKKVSSLRDAMVQQLDTASKLFMEAIGPNLIPETDIEAKSFTDAIARELQQMPRGGFSVPPPLHLNPAVGTGSSPCQECAMKDQQLQGTLARLEQLCQATEEWRQQAEEASGREAALEQQIDQLNNRIQELQQRPNTYSVDPETAERERSLQARNSELERLLQQAQTERDDARKEAQSLRDAAELRRRNTETEDERVRDRSLRTSELNTSGAPPVDVERQQRKLLELQAYTEKLYSEYQAILNELETQETANQQLRRELAQTQQLLRENGNPAVDAVLVEEAARAGRAEAERTARHEQRILRQRIRELEDMLSRTK